MPNFERIQTSHGQQIANAYRNRADDLNATVSLYQLLGISLITDLSFSSSFLSFAVGRKNAS